MRVLFPSSARLAYLDRRLRFYDTDSMRLSDYYWALENPDEMLVKFENKFWHFRVVWGLLVLYPVFSMSLR